MQGTFNYTVQGTFNYTPPILISAEAFDPEAFGGVSFKLRAYIHTHIHTQGTFNYMSPEAFDPETFGGVSFKADSWSFACSILEMITGMYVCMYVCVCIYMGLCTYILYVYTCVTAPMYNHIFSCVLDFGDNNWYLCMYVCVG